MNRCITDDVAGDIAAALRRIIERSNELEKEGEACLSDEANMPNTVDECFV